MKSKAAEALEQLTQRVEREWPKLRQPGYTRAQCAGSGQRLRRAAERARAFLDGPSDA